MLLVSKSVTCFNWVDPTIVHYLNEFFWNNIFHMLQYLSLSRHICHWIVSQVWRDTITSSSVGLKLDDTPFDIIFNHKSTFNAPIFMEWAGRCDSISWLFEPIAQISINFRNIEKIDLCQIKVRYQYGINVPKSTMKNHWIISWFWCSNNKNIKTIIKNGEPYAVYSFKAYIHAVKLIMNYLNCVVIKAIAFAHECNI